MGAYLDRTHLHRFERKVHFHIPKNLKNPRRIRKTQDITKSHPLKAFEFSDQIPLGGGIRTHTEASPTGLEIRRVYQFRHAPICMTNSRAQSFIKITYL